MNFYLFSQNSSGGSYKGPHFVIVKSRDLNDAVYYAKKYCGIYFNGVENGLDCECCGDRWDIPYSDEKVSSVDEIIERVKTYHYLNELDVMFYSPEMEYPKNYLVKNDRTI